MTIGALKLLGGIVLLLVGGRLLVSASVDAARRLRVPSLLIGLTLVAWGTSAPELALNLVSAAKGRAELALGNVVGANICNIALVLGACALVRPLVVQERLIRVEILLNACVLGFMSAVVLAGKAAGWTSAVMLGVFGSYSTWTVMSALRPRASDRGLEAELQDPAVGGEPMGWVMIAACFAGGLVLLSVGGSMASDGASGIALSLGVAPAIVGVTIVSVGTTLPEAVTGLLAVRKGQTDLAMGNAIGSCLFNAGAVFGVVGLISRPVIDGSLTVPLVYMALLAVAMVPIGRSFNKTVSRAEGAGLLLSYAAFLAVSALTTGSATV